MEENGKLNNVYIGALKLRNIKCFKGEHIIDFTDKDGKLFQWTVIMGNNNTGKTTILRAIADLEPIKFKEILRKDTGEKVSSYVPINIERRSVWRIDKLKKLSKPFIGTKLLESASFPTETLSEKAFRELIIGDKESDSFNSWGFDVNRSRWSAAMSGEVEGLILYGYGVNRRAGETNISNTTSNSNTATLFDDGSELINVEEWLIQLDYSQKSKRIKAKNQLKKIKRLLSSGLLPDVKNFKFVSDEDLNNYVEFKTDYGWVRLHELGYGYRSSIAWIVDLAKKMFERYPDSENPLAEAAVVLVDELDLHLHPEWQRNVISFLTKHFPNTQFIVTAHSPLVVQSAERVNIVLLSKEEDHIVITQPEIPTYKGWSVEEILSELMNLGERTHSDAYLQLMDAFEQALDKEDFEKAQEAYEQLEAILHPNSSQRKLLRMQMSAIVHD